MLGGGETGCKEKLNQDEEMIVRKEMGEIRSIASPLFFLACPKVSFISKFGFRTRSSKTQIAHIKRAGLKLRAKTF